MPKISIITTAYKHQDFISKTIESIISQSFTDWELLIWDDSPDDLTWNIIQSYVNKYTDKIKAWHNNPNKWIVDNMNFLIEKVSNDSEYVAFLEWDDLYTPDNLEKKIKVFNDFPDVWMVYNNLDFIDENWEIFYKNYLKKTPFYLKNEKLSKINFIKYETFYMSYSSLMIKKSILNNEKILNLSKSKTYSVSDWDLFFRLSNKYNCYWIEKSLTLYRFHNNNFSWSDNFIILNDLEIVSDYYLITNFINNYESNKLNWRISILKCKKYINIWNKEIALKLYLKSLYLFPSYDIRLKMVSFVLLLTPYKIYNFWRKIRKKDY